MFWSTGGRTGWFNFFFILLHEFVVVQHSWQQQPSTNYCDALAAEKLTNKRAGPFFLFFMQQSPSPHACMHIIKPRPSSLPGLVVFVVDRKCVILKKIIKSMFVLSICNNAHPTIIISKKKSRRSQTYRLT